MASWLGGLVQGGDGSSAKIALLLDRLRSASMIAERRDAVENLRELALANQSEMGQLGLPTLLQVLQAEPRDAEVTQSIVEILAHLVTVQEPPIGGVDGRSGGGGGVGGGGVGGPMPPGAAGAAVSKGGTSFDFLAAPLRNTDALLGEPANVELLLDLLQEREMWVRLNTIALLIHLKHNRGEKLEEVLLQCPVGMQRLVEVLTDSNEKIRNDMLLLLRLLTESSPNVRQVSERSGAQQNGASNPTWGGAMRGFECSEGHRDVGMHDFMIICYGYVPPGALPRKLDVRATGQEIRARWVVSGAWTLPSRRLLPWVRPVRAKAFFAATRSIESDSLFYL